MGFNTTIFVLNDHLYDIEKNPQRFVEEVVQAIHRGVESDGRVFGQSSVMQTAHADIHRLYMSHGNAMIDLTAPYWLETKMKGAAPERKKFLRDYYKQQIKVAKSILRDWEKHLKQVEIKEANEQVLGADNATSR